MDELEHFINEYKEKITAVSKGMDLESVKDKTRSLEQDLQIEEVWHDVVKQKELSIELAHNKAFIEKIEGINRMLRDLKVLSDIAASEDQEFLKEIKEIQCKVKEEYSNIEIMYLLNNEYDRNGCFIRISAGAGGTESCDWVDILARMYKKWMTLKKMHYTEIDSLAGDVAGHRYVVCKVDSPFAYGFLKNESGIHRLVRNSPFDSQNRRHTSFASVHVTPKVDVIKGKLFEIKDLNISASRSSGAGGQHVNTTDSKVRVKHIPTGIVVTCQKERSQAKNKEFALEILQSKLMSLSIQEQNKKMSVIISDKEDISWGNQRRNYVLSPYKIIKDVFTGESVGDADGFLNGEYLEGFIKAALIKHEKEKHCH